MTGETKTKAKLHIAMFPWLAHGHMTPFLQLSVFLSRKGHQITFLSTPKNIKAPRQKLSSLITFVALELGTVPGLPDRAESTSELPVHLVPYLKKAYDSLEAPLTEFLENNDVDLIVYDFVPHWLPGLADRLGIESAYFSTFNATLLVFLGPPVDLISGRRFSKPEDLTTVPDWIPYRTTSVFRPYEVSKHQTCMDDAVSDFIRFGETMQGCKFILVRACEEFEKEQLSLSNKIMNKPVIPIGLLPPTKSVSDDVDDARWSALKSWLDMKKEKSVIYIALGTEVMLSQELMHELARGIEESGLPFVWVVRNSPGRRGGASCPIPDPDGFEDRVSDRGFVWKGWAPQPTILAHGSVGGFLTHCGWNSVIEALGCGRVLVLFSGGSSDQGLMARFLQDKGVGLEVPRDEQDGTFRASEVAETIRLVMVRDEGEPLRAKAWAMKDVFGNTEIQNGYLEKFARFLEKKFSRNADIAA